MSLKLPLLLTNHNKNEKDCEIIELEDSEKFSSSNKQTFVSSNNSIASLKEKNFSIFSKAFFLWPTELLRLSQKQTIDRNTVIKYGRFTSEENTKEFYNNFLGLKKIWEKYKNWKISPFLFTLIHLNWKDIIFVIILNWILQSMKIGVIFFKRRIVQLFYDREEENITDYSYKKFVFLLGQAIFGFGLVEGTRLIIKQQAKFYEKTLSRKTTNQIILAVYEKFLINKVLQTRIKEGDLIDYIEVDSESMSVFFLHLAKLLVFPFQFVFYMIILYKIFNKAFLIGITVFFTFIFIAFLIDIAYIKNQYSFLEAKDNRVSFLSQTVKNIKELKLLQWEDKFQEITNKKREKELIFLKKQINFILILDILHFSIPILFTLSTIGSYVKINNSFLPITDLMTALDVFDSITNPIGRLTEYVRSMINTFISMNRISKFLIIDTEKKSNITRNKNDKYSINLIDAKIGFEDKILLNINELKIKKNESSIIIGETGSGKSCLIKSLIDRLIIYNKKEFNIDGIISYAAQQPFIINATIRDNIIFYSKFNFERYKKVLEISQLENDIEKFPAGDMTEIGMNGVNISGGQKSRINLARCIYKEADIYLFDDPISSVDAIVCNKILLNLTEDFLKNKTIIFAANELGHLEYFKNIIFIEKGIIKYQGKTDDIENKDFFQKFKTNNNSIKKHNHFTKEEENTIINRVAHKMICMDEAKNDDDIILENMTKDKGKLTIDEKITGKSIEKKVYKKIIKYSGGFIFFIFVLIFAVVWQVSKIYGSIYLTDWSDNFDEINHNISDKSNIYYLLIYAQIGAISIFSQFLKDYFISKMSFNIQKNFHEIMLQNIISAPINTFFDITSFGQIMNKFTFEYEKMALFFRHLSLSLKALCSFLGASLACLIVYHYCLFFLPIIFFMGYKVSKFYMPGGRCLLRIESIDRGPLVSFYSESISGIDTIKSLNYFKIEKIMFEKFVKQLAEHRALTFNKFGAHSFFELSLDLLSVFFILILLIFCTIFNEKFGPVTVGLLLKFSLRMSDEILTLLSHGTDLQNSAVRVERCELYTNLPKENFKGKIIVKNDNEFHGIIEYKNVSIKYRPNLPLALNNISIKILPDEKIGIVGRTGGGKSSLILGLFRILETIDGNIFINNMNIKDIPIKILRRHLGIVPQEPKIFKGTLRFNLDPLKKYSNDEINNAINEVGLFKLMKENGRNIKNGLDTKMKENGGNLSLGEKQLICLARTFLRKNKIVVLDEATSNIDNKTELLIQEAVDKIFKNSTLITIIHKLQNVQRYDKILVVSDGRIVEFDKPINLLNKSKGVFKELYENE